MSRPLEQEITKMEGGKSPFEEAIRQMPVALCQAFGQGSPIAFRAGRAMDPKPGVAEHFARISAGSAVLEAGGALPSLPTGKRIAVVFSGGPAAGGHNVIAGLKRALGANTLLGVRKGPGGLVKGNLFPITDLDVARVTNTGGFDLLGTDRTKIKQEEQFASVEEVCRANKLDALVVVGGDDSNTNAAVLAERLLPLGVQVIGVPKTIDGDLQCGGLLPISFGFDTATKVYAELVGNILQDTLSSLKYWHFVRLMGRSASHVTMEVALQTRPHYTVISEEVAEKRTSLGKIVDEIAGIVIARAAQGKKYGVVLVPEGLLEFIPQVGALIRAIDGLFADAAFAGKSIDDRIAQVGGLEGETGELFGLLPGHVQSALVAERDSHGNLAVSQIETERLLADMVAVSVKRQASGTSFSPITHFFGYEGRCAAPSAFDAWYGYNLGFTAGCLVLAGKTGYLASITEFERGGVPAGLPLTGLITVEMRKGKAELVIEKALVTTDSPAFRYFQSRRKAWAEADCYCSPGPRQYGGVAQMPISVALNQQSPSLSLS